MAPDRTKAAIPPDTTALHTAAEPTQWTDPREWMPDHTDFWNGTFDVAGAWDNSATSACSTVCWGARVMSNHTCNGGIEAQVSVHDSKTGQQFPNVTGSTDGYTVGMESYPILFTSDLTSDEAETIVADVMLDTLRCLYP